MGLLLTLLLLAGNVYAQEFGPTSWAPTRNALAASSTTDIAVGFSQALTNNAATRSALVVSGSQASGYKQGTATVSGNSLNFNPAESFKPGEVVSATVTTAVQSSNQQALPRPYVYQFTTATAAGTGVFRSNPEVPLSNPFSLVVGDVDSDGDLDLLSVNSVSTGPQNTVSVRLNTGNGIFTNGQEIPGIGVGRILLGDLDGDGKLDLVTSGGVYINNGGTFGNPEPARLGGTAIGDVDGDGDLDLVTEGLTSTGATPSTAVRVRLNNGRAGFSEGPMVPVSLNASTVVLGDVNNDGALDLLASGRNGFIDVRLNTGHGSFASTGQRLDIATMPGGLLLGDVDGDSDLDLVAANTGSTVAVVLNNGQGTFDAKRFINLGSFAVFEALGDVDGDGDLDLLAGGFPNSVSLRLNDGQGNFSGDQATVVSESPRAIALGDLNGDGTLDFATANSSSGAIGSASIRLNPPKEPSSTLYRLNAGGGAISTSQGAFAADQYYAPTPGHTYSSGAAIAGTTDDALYQTERYGTNGVMSYALPVANGSYTVRLHFAELYWTSAGQRVFDAAIENAPVLTAYDIYKRVGANTAVTETFLVMVSDGVLNLDFTSLNAGGVDNPKVAAIEVLPGSAGSVPTAYRLNVGGETLSTSTGFFYVDQAYSPVPGNTYTTSAAIAGTTDDALYQSERYDSNGAFAYALPVANGLYRVTLHFAEIYFEDAGQRVFDVAAENTQVLTSYDIVKKVGAFTATTETFLVPVADGTLNLDFTSLNPSGRNNPKVSAIEVAPAGAAATAVHATSMLEAYPNPFTNKTTLHFQAPETGPAQLLVYNALGQLVATPFNGVVEAGQGFTCALIGTSLPAGVYTCRLLLGGKVHTQRLALVK
jgi:hypothetical protein